MFVNSDHAGNKQSRISRTGFMIYMKVLLINWYSKKQSTIEATVFGLVFVGGPRYWDTHHPQLISDVMQCVHSNFNGNKH